MLAKEKYNKDCDQGDIKPTHVRTHRIEHNAPNKKPNRTSQGIVVTFQLTERPLIKHVRFVGNRGISDKSLRKEAGIKPGDPMNQFAVEDARRKIQSLYQQKGYPKALVEVFVDAEDFELPTTMEGKVAVEIRKEALKQYDIRFAIEEAIQLVPGDNQETIALALDHNLAPGGLSLNGDAGTIQGQAEVEQILLSLPWEMVVEMFWDCEGYSETQCETNTTTGEEECVDIWIDGEEAPDVDGNMNVKIPGITGEVDVSSVTDIFNF